MKSYKEYIKEIFEQCEETLLFYLTEYDIENLTEFKNDFKEYVEEWFEDYGKEKYVNRLFDKACDCLSDDDLNHVFFRHIQTLLKDENFVKDLEKTLENYV